MKLSGEGNVWADCAILVITLPHNILFNEKFESGLC